MQSSDFDDADKWVVKWQCGYLGDFQTALAKAIACADDTNLVYLSMGFDMQVKGFKRWTRGDLAKRLRNAGLDI